MNRLQRRCFVALNHLSAAIMAFRKGTGEGPSRFCAFVFSAGNAEAEPQREQIAHGQSGFMGGELGNTCLLGLSGAGHEPGHAVANQGSGAREIPVLLNQLRAIVRLD